MKMSNDDLLLVCPTCGGVTRIVGHVCNGCWNNSNYLSMKWYGKRYQAGIDRIKVELKKQNAKMA